MLHAALSRSVLVESSQNQAGVTDLTWHQVGTSNSHACCHRVTERETKIQSDGVLMKCKRRAFNVLKYVDGLHVSLHGVQVYI